MAHWHTVRRGESVPSIAERYGFKTWQTIYEHAGNAELRKLRPDPNVLAPGDRLFIPNKEQRYVQCATEQVHRFQLKRAMTQVRLVLEAEDGTIFGGKRYVLKVGNQSFEGVTASDGLLEETVPAIADAGELTVWLDASQRFTWDLDIGHLDPIDEVGGLQARLANLGFEPGPTDGQLGDVTQAALRAFQEAQGLEATGQPDAATKQKLVEVHGS